MGKHTHTHTHTLAGRQTGSQAERQTGRQTDRQSNGETEGLGRQARRQSGRHTDGKWMDRQPNRQTDDTRIRIFLFSRIQIQSDRCRKMLNLTLNNELAVDDTGC